MSKAKSAIPVDAYIRVSRVGGREGDSFISPDLQRESIERVCKREGLQVVKWFEELDASGGDNKRPKWNEAIKRVEQGKTKGMVCWNLSRFSRSLKDALTAVERIEDAGGQIYCEEGDLPALARNILWAVAEDERKRATVGFKNAVANAIDRGIYVAAKVPFGYFRDPETRRLIPDPATSPIVQELFEQRAKGQSWKQLADWIKEAHGIEKARVTIRDMIGNRAYLGVAYNGDMVNEKAHKPLVSKLLYDKANAARGRKPVHTGAAQAFLLRGIIRCGNCGHALTLSRTYGKVIKPGKTWKEAERERLHTYVCRNLHCDEHAYGRATDVDEYVTDSILAFLRFFGPELEQEASNPNALGDAKKSYEEAEYALEQFTANKRAITTLGVDRWNDLLEGYVVERDAALIEYQTLLDADEDHDYAKVADYWNEWTNESRREYLTKIVRECVLHKGTEPLNERIDLDVNVTGTETKSIGATTGFAHGRKHRGKTTVEVR